MSEVSLLNIKQVCNRVGLCRQSIYNKLTAGEFPRPVHPGPRAVRWPSDEIDRWIEGLREARAA